MAVLGTTTAELGVGACRGRGTLGLKAELTAGMVGGEAIAERSCHLRLPLRLAGASWLSDLSTSPKGSCILLYCDADGASVVTSAAPAVPALTP